MKNLKTILALAALVIFATSCGSSTDSTSQEGRQGQVQKDAATLIKEMDTDNDGMLSKAEVKGPLANDFSKIDSNSDGKISLTELKNAPKPQGGKPPRRN